MPKILSFLSDWLITPNFSSVLFFFSRFFTWISLNDVDLRFSRNLATKTKSVEGRTVSFALLYHQPNQSTHVTVGFTVMSFSASLQHKTSAARDCLWQIFLNRKLSRVFEKLCKFSSRVEAKSRKKKSRKTTPAFIVNSGKPDVRATQTLLNFGYWRIFG
jgi:hypothetical protein